MGLWFERSPEPIVAPPGDEVLFECSLNVGSERVLWKHNSEYLPAEDKSHGTTRLVKVNDSTQAGDYQVINTLILWISDLFICHPTILQCES